MALRKGHFSTLLVVALAVFFPPATEAPDPCCLRVTPYHIQALAQRMAQRFQALEYRAQDLRGVFASFQAVHGNVSHRLRYLEMEHAHLSEMVSRLDSRLQSLEEEKKMEEYRHRVGYYRAPRDAGVAHHGGDRNTMNPAAAHPRPNKHFYRSYLRHRGRFAPQDSPHKQNEDQTLTRKNTRAGRYPANSFRDSEDEKVTPEGNRERLAFPYVRLRRNEMSIVLPPLRVHLDQPGEPAPDITSPELPQPTSAAVGVDEESSSHSSDPPREREESGSVAPEPEASSAADESPLFVVAEASTVMTGGGGTTPTPLWQLEESADALLQAMSAGDEDEAAAAAPPALPPPSASEEDESVSFWAPANETDSLEQLYDAANAIEPTKCSGRSNCTVTEPSPTHVIHDSTTLTPDANLLHLAQNALDSISSPSGVEDASETHPTSSDIDNTIPVMSTAKTKIGCQNFSTPTPTNGTEYLEDFFASNASVAGNGSACEGSGCEATSSELSDAELQEALRELDALLQRPPAADADAAASPPPDPEKLLLKRALKLALAALERTSDACLTLVNFTADAFEGLAAAEGMTGVTGAA